MVKLKEKRSGMLAAAVFGLLLAACAPAEEAETTPAQDVEPVAAVISATGEVVPERYATLAFETDGQVAEVLVEEGDVVAAGDVLARLNARQLEAAVAQAEAGLGVAEATLAEVRAGPRQETIAEAASQVQAAQARIDAAQARRDQLFTAITEDQIVAAQYELAQAEEAAEDVREAMQTLLFNAEVKDLTEFEAGGSDNPLTPGEELARALELSELNLTLARARLDDLLDGPDVDLVELEEARIEAAEAQRNAAGARLALLNAQPFEEDIAIAQARVADAEVALEEARARLDQATIIALFPGTIADVFIDEGEYVTPGQDIIQLGDLDGLIVETTDLNEIDVAQIEVGDAVLVTFDAIPDEIVGTVERISPRSEDGVGVNYTVEIALEEIPGTLRWGMTAFVDIEVD